MGPKGNLAKNIQGYYKKTWIYFQMKLLVKLSIIRV